jgi:flagellar biosynthesis/type III secretory pathway protein FliH
MSGVPMTTLLRTVRVSSDEASSLTVARLDYDLAEGPLAQGSTMDPRIVDPLLEELVQKAVADAEAQARTRGYEDGYTQGREKLVEEIRDQLDRETGQMRAEIARIRDELQRAHEDEEARRAAENARLQALMHEATETLRAAMTSLDDAIIPRYEEVGRDLTRVVLALVEDILGRELTADRAHVTNIVTRALAEIPGRTAVSIAMNPGDIDLLAQFDVDLTEALGRPVEVIADTTIDRHGAIVISGCTQVDAQIRSSLERLREALAA